MVKTKYCEAIEKEIREMTETVKRISEWTDSLLKDHSDENIMSFMYDTYLCHGEMFPRCTECPYVCFKKFVLWNISFESKKTQEQIENRMEELSKS